MQAPAPAPRPGTPERPAVAPPDAGPPTAAAPEATLPSKPFMINLPARTRPNEGQLLGKTIVGSMGLTGLLVVAALGIGVVLASGWIVWRRRRRTYDVDAPPSLGPMPAGPMPADDRPTAPPPSSRDR